MKRRLPIDFLIPIAVVAVFAILSVTKLTDGLEFRLFDMELHFRKSPTESKLFLLVDFDDEAISRLGTWPASRQVTGDGLMLLRELGVQYTTFDIEYINRSPRGVNSEVLTTGIPEVFNSEFSVLKDEITGFAEALRKKQIPLKDAGDYAKQLADIADKSNNKMQNEVQKIALDNDAYMAGSARFFGNAFFTVNMQDSVDSTVPKELRAATIQRHALKNLTDKANLPKKTEIIPTIDPINASAAGVGFTNVTPDADGVRRRILLIQRYGDSYFPQLVFAPLLNLLANPAITIEKRAITLKNAKIPGRGTHDIRIPLAEDGTMLINWPHKKYLPSFTHLPYMYLLNHKDFLDTIVYDLKIRESWGYFNLYQGPVSLLDQYKAGETLRAAIMNGAADPSKTDEYIAGREKFYAELGSFLDSKPEDQILASVDQVLADPSTPKASKEEYLQIKADAPVYFKNLRGTYKSLMETRKTVRGMAQGTLAVIGLVATGTSDIGVNPFVGTYPNIGTHASLANTILNEDFITFASVWWSILIAFAFSVSLGYITRTMKPLYSILVGFAFTVAAFAAITAVFMFTGIYLPGVPILVTVFITFVALTVLHFLNTEKEKGFLRNAFSHYLSGEVIREIIANPEKLKLGGSQKVMTAVFTDIRSFSTVSEKLTPEELVRLLNQYLTAMSDTILDLKGTIDKYEGDAIIAFFGAPLDLPDHAERACRSAVRMKKIESENNKRFMEENLTPSPLLTRIGINTGDMVVGNMGTSRKMDYTIIGDAVNLASRLEGVNKLYGTWICISEDTQKSAGPNLVTRKLDRVRVVGKSVPIRIFELVGEKGSIDGKTEDLLAAFEKALDSFEQREWKKSAEGFEKALKILEDDGPSLRYLKLCKEYATTPPPEAWDGVFQLTSK
jgi:adenylate cyclase